MKPVTFSEKLFNIWYEICIFLLKFMEVWMSMIKLLLIVAGLLMTMLLGAQVSENITLESEVMLSLGNVCDIEIRGSQVWLSGSEHMLMSFQLSTDNDPSLLGYYKLSDDVYANPASTNYGNLLICGDYLYFYEQMGGVQVFNISDPSSIQLMGSITNCEIPNQRFVQQGVLVYALESYGFKVWNFTDPLNPIIMGEFAHQYSVEGIVVNGNYAYMSYYQSQNGPWRVAIINVSDASNPMLVSSFAVAGFQLAWYNGYLYTDSPSANSLSIYNLSDPVAPVYAGSVPFPQQTGQLLMKADGNYLYLRNDPYLVEYRTIPSNYLCFDLSVPSAPIALPEILTSSFQYHGEFAVGGNYFIANISYYQVDIYVNNDSGLQRQSTIQRDGVFRSAMLGNYLLLNSGNALNTASLNSEPIFLKNSDYLCVKDNSVFTSSFYSLFKWCLNANEEPELANQLQIWPTGEYHEYPTSYPVNAVGEYIYSNRIFFDTNLSDTIQDVYSPYGDPGKIVTTGNTAIAIYYTGLKIFDISNPLQPVQISSLFNGTSLWDISVSGNLLAIAKADIGLYLYDISNPASPQMLCYKPNAVGIYYLKIIGNYLITSGTHELVVYSLSDPSQPAPTGFYSDPEKYFYDVQVHNNKAYVCQGYQLSAFDLSAAVSNPDTPELPSEAISLTNYPNPFMGSTTITISGKTDKLPCELTVFNLKGQKVRCLHSGILNNAEDSYEWNGLDSSGKPVAAGVYLYRFAQGNTIITKRLLRIK